MTTTAYRLTPEFYVMPPAHYDGRAVPSIDFHYAIRRDDGSLVFRAQTIAYAEEILDNPRRS